MTREEFIRQVPLFKELRPEEITILCELTRTIMLKKGEVLFRKDDEGTALYIIQQGSVKIVLPSVDGDEIIPAIFTRGDFFGEMSLLDGMPRSADAVAMELCELLVLNRSNFLDFIKGNENVIQSILYALSMRLRRTDDLLEDTCFLNISARFAKKLLELAEEHGEQEGDLIFINLDLKQRDLASMVGATRESINKELRLLREKGLISMIGNQIQIYNLEFLKRRVH
jgi:CRP/FNR family transcriptional regulator, cyclic AMP receptor protein